VTPANATVCPTGWRIPTKTEASRLNPDMNSSYWYKEGWVISAPNYPCDSNSGPNGLRIVTTDNSGYYWNNNASWEWRAYTINEVIQVRCIQDY
jgi:hypothetical protein